MMGLSQDYRNLVILAMATLLLTSGCMQPEPLASPSDEPQAEVAAAVAPPPPPPVAIPAREAAARERLSKKVKPKAKIGKGLGAILPRRTGIPSYPVWPPEAPSSRVSLDRFIQARTNLSLYDAGQKLKRSFEQAGYLEYGYYAAPGGFVLVTRIEKISAKGDRLPGTERYKLPSERSSGSLTSFVRGLFLDAPPGFYRYIAVVVSDKPYQTSRKTLSSKQAETRLTRGSNNLSSVYRNVPFTKDYNVDALIYEFTKDARTGNVRMIAPGRLTPSIHLAKTKLKKTIVSNFGR